MADPPFTTETAEAAWAHAQEVFVVCESEEYTPVPLPDFLLSFATLTATVVWDANLTDDEIREQLEDLFYEVLLKSDLV